MEIKIRKALSSDLESINHIYNHIHTEEENGAVSIGWIRDVYPTKETAKDALLRNDLFVEEADGEIVGTAIINQIQVDIYKDAAWQYEFPNEKIMVLHTLVIDPYVKGHGFRKKFVEYYEQYARENGCCSLRMDTNARKFYKKLGYHEIGVLPCQFNGIPDVQLVLLEKNFHNFYYKNTRCIPFVIF